MSSKSGSKKQTFAEIVAAVESDVPVPSKDSAISPGRFSGDTLYDLAGHALREVDDHALDPAEIRDAVLAGALLAWDSCGCGGYCNTLKWPDPESLLREASSAIPRFRKNHPARVTRLRGEGGDVLLVAGDLRWGDLFR